MNHSLIFLTFFSSAYSNAQPTNNFLPDKQYFLESGIGIGIDKASTYFSACFALTSNTRPPSGYARLAFTQVDNSFLPKLESSTYADISLEACLLSSGGELRKNDSNSNSNSWSYAHIISECKIKDESIFYRIDNITCKVIVVLNNFSEDEKIRQIVESHWKYPQIETNQLYFKSMQILNLLQLLKQ